jgi:membrane protein YqaA with SNARE-associated domain
VPVRRLFFLRLNHWWRAFLLALAAYAVIGTIVLALVPDLAGVFLLGAYCIPANSIIPFPHEPAVLFFARFYDPLLIAVAATIGSIIASFADYAMVGAAMRHRALASTRQSPLFQWALRWMRRYPFAIIVLFSFTPLPISVVRILAPAVDYPIRRYVLAQVVGRLPRFYILAWIGHAFVIPTWALLAMLVLLLGSVVMSARGGDAAAEDLDPTDDDLDDDLASASVR